MNSLLHRFSEVMGCWLASRRALARHAAGELDDTTLSVHLQVLHRRLGQLRRTHWSVDALIELLSRPSLLDGRIAWLLALMVVSLFLGSGRS